MEILGTICTSLLMAGCSWGSYVLGKYAGSKEIQQEAINKGFAQYNSKTGEFEWK